MAMQAGGVTMRVLVWMAATAGTCAPAAAAGSAQKPTLTGTELRHCVELDARWQDLHGRVQQSNQNLDAAKATMDHIDSMLDSEETQLDHTKADWVDDYNRRVLEQSARVAAYNASLPAHTALVAEHNAIIDAFNRDCALRVHSNREWLKARVDLPPSR